MIPNSSLSLNKPTNIRPVEIRMEQQKKFFATTICLWNTIEQAPPVKVKKYKLKQQLLFGRGEIWGGYLRTENYIYRDFWINCG